MEKFILASIESLGEAIKSDPRVKKLDDLEKQVNQSPVIIALSKKKDEAEEDYASAISLYKKGSAELAKAEHDLYLAKLSLDEDPLSKEYNKAYIEVSDLYREIDDVIFSPFRKKTLSSLDK